MAETLLVVNAGSSSIKIQLFDVTADDRLDLEFRGQMEGIGTRPRLTVKDAAGGKLVDDGFGADEVPDIPGALDRLDGWLVTQLGGLAPIAIGHRVVHGGPDYSAPVRIDAAVVERLQQLVPLAPLHQPNNLAPIREILRRYPQIPQVACFDTAFHRQHPAVADRFAIPDTYYREGVRRYGFHGLSYEYVADHLRDIDPALAAGRVVACHLGSGASMCAIKAGHSLDSTMGFTAVDGLPMGTRTGQLDPGVILYLVQSKGYGAVEIERFLYHDGGLKGLSGISNDMRDLLASDEPGAKLAVDYFVYRIVREAGAMASAMGGIDGIVFTAGIGERSPEIRGRVSAGLAWLGLELDAAADAADGPLLSTAQSKLRAYAIPTNEELMIARHTMRLVDRAG